jgi:hypothetical protein
MDGRDPSIEIRLLDDDVLSNNEPVRGEFPKAWENTLHVLLKIHEDDDYWKISARIDKCRGMHAVSAEETTDSMNRARTCDVFAPKEM